MNEDAGTPVFEGPVDDILAEKIVEHSQETAGNRHAASDRATIAGGQYCTTSCCSSKWWIPVGGVLLFAVVLWGILRRNSCRKLRS